MSRSTISTFQLFEMFPDEDSARQYLEDRLWPKGPVCPDCKSGERVSALGTCATRKAGFYRCLACNFDFTIRTNTIFERSKVPLHKWLYSMYLLVTARKGISSLQLAKEIDVTQKTAWFILGRLREACGGPEGPLDKLRGTRLGSGSLTRGSRNEKGPGDSRQDGGRSTRVSPKTEVQGSEEAPPQGREEGKRRKPMILNDQCSHLYNSHG